MHVAPNDACSYADRPYFDEARDTQPRPLMQSEPRLIFGGLTGLALAARFCRTQLDDGTWSGLAQMARKLDADHAYRVKDSTDWKVKCECDTVHVVPPREIVTCGCDRLFMQDGDDAWVFELGPQDPDDAE
jgi:hypothetical protein